MTGNVHVAELGFWVGAVALLAWGATLSFGYLACRARLRVLDPETRERALFAWGLAPWVLGLTLVVGCFLPSLTDWLGLAADHCLEHIAHHPHLCFHHGGGVERGAAAGALAALVTIAVFACGTVGLRNWWQYIRLVGGFAALSEKTAGDGVLWVATRRPLAFTLGTLAPRIFVSEGLAESLEGDDLRAVLAHEQGHVERRDGLRKLLLAALTLPLLPPVRRRVLEDHALACEELCDRVAGEKLGEPALVARALLAVTRLDTSTVLSPACRFGSRDTAHRVNSLLSPCWVPAGSRWAGAFGVGYLMIGSLTFFTAGRLHHLVETGLSVLF